MMVVSGRGGGGRSGGGGGGQSRQEQRGATTATVHHGDVQLFLRFSARKKRAVFFPRFPRRSVARYVAVVQYDTLSESSSFSKIFLRAGRKRYKKRYKNPREINSYD
jgi:hypothetical protein